MSVELILFGVIALVFVLDFLLKGFKKKKTENNSVTDEVSTLINQTVLNKRAIWLSFLYSFLLSIIVSPTIYVLKDYLIYNDLSKDNLQLLFEVFLFDRFNTAVLYFLLSFFVFLFAFNIRRLYSFRKFFSNYFIYFSKYLISRKKNTTLFLISNILLKVLIHYIFYPSSKNLGYYFEVIFQDRIIIFLFSLLTTSFFAWYFNDRIKAR